jgi:fatty acid desaturase
MKAALLRQRPPSLPARFVKPTGPWVCALFIGHALVLCFGPGLLAMKLLQHSGWGRLPAWPLVGLLALLSGFGLNLLAGLGHEGFHFTLARSRRLSARLGIVFSAASLGFLAVGFHLADALHHRHTNRALDPDLQRLRHWRHPLLRLLCVQAAQHRHSRVLVRRLLVDGALPAGLTPVFPLFELQGLALLNIGAQIGWLLAYALLSMADPLCGLCLVLLPHIGAALVGAAVAFAQHGDTGEAPWDNARSHPGWLASLLMGGTNHHLEHHLYPRVPCWRLGRVHRWLALSPWARQHRLKTGRGLWAGLRVLRPRVTYGPALIAPPKRRKRDAVGA